MNDLTYIIDDDSIFVFVFKKILEKNDDTREIVNIQNGQDAINVLKTINKNRQKLPDLIFLDLNMPVLDGWQFLDELEKLPFKDELKIHIISSTIDSNEIAKAKNYSSVKSFISKPINAVDLARVLETE
jgi:CheY-like chemotaxis protein